MHYGRGVERAGGHSCPIGRREPAKRDEDKYPRHHNVKAPGIGTDGRAVGECCFHGQTPEFYILGSLCLQWGHLTNLHADAATVAIATRLLRREPERGGVVWGQLANWVSVVP